MQPLPNFLGFPYMYSWAMASLQHLAGSAHTHYRTALTGLPHASWWKSKNMIPALMSYSNFSLASPDAVSKPNGRSQRSGVRAPGFHYVLSRCPLRPEPQNFPRLWKDDKNILNHTEGLLCCLFRYPEGTIFIHIVSGAGDCGRSLDMFTIIFPLVTCLFGARITYSTFQSNSLYTYLVSILVEACQILNWNKAKKQASFQ